MPSAGPTGWGAMLHLHVHTIISYYFVDNVISVHTIFTTLFYDVCMEEHVVA